ncbi:MAG: hypothetical protein ACR2HX_17550 [Pyrinomonadaceae bacterium]
MALDERYRTATEEGADRGAEGSLQDFVVALGSSQAVIARKQDDMFRLATSDNEIYGTFYNLTGAGLRLPEGSKWDILRGVVDSALFPNYREQIRFAALSLNGIGPTNYGEYSITLRTDMIAHRATVLEENSILFMAHHKVEIAEAHRLPEGYRATWSERVKLCIAKLSRLIGSVTKANEYPEILLRQGVTSVDEQFVEVHIFGPLTIRTIERVTLTQPKRVNRATIKAIKAKLEKVKVKVS